MARVCGVAVTVVHEIVVISVPDRVVAAALAVLMAVGRVLDVAGRFTFVPVTGVFTVHVTVVRVVGVVAVRNRLMLAGGVVGVLMG